MIIVLNISYNIGRKIIRPQRLFIVAMSLFIATSIGYSNESNNARLYHDLNSRLNQIAESYVKLVLAVGQYDSIYVDAFYGPKEWLTEAQSAKKSLNTVRQVALSLAAELDSLDSNHEEEILQMRHQYLKKQLSSLIARVEVLGGKKLSFDEEAKAYYDVDPPSFPEEYFKKLIAELDTIIPGKGLISERIKNYRRQFTVTPERVDTVLRIAIHECRIRTKKYIKLSDNETFQLEFVNNKPWGAYNWYKGNNESLIQINIDIPTYLHSVIDCAAHEGYPGHHVYNCLLETEFASKRGWVEFTVYALFSPQSLIAEGTANFGIEVAFPGKERMEFERDVLFPLAGLDKSLAENYSKVQTLIGKLSYAENEAARRYLNGEISHDEAAQWLINYTLRGPKQAQFFVRFIDVYRSYVINYNLGLDLVRQYIDRRGGAKDRPEKRWEEFTRLLASPRLPSGLI
jgi:hypothetical protein